MRTLRRILPTITAAALLICVVGCSNSLTKESDSNSSSTQLDPATRAYLTEVAATLAMQLSIDNPPEVATIRMISLSEWSSTQIACLNEAGFEVSDTEDGQGIRFPYTDDPALIKSLNLARYVCEVQYPTDPKYMAEPTQSQLEKLYTYRAGELISCLADLGYPSSEVPPSESVFIQSGGAWSPYEYLTFSEEDLKRVNRECPQTPESFYGD